MRRFDCVMLRDELGLLEARLMEYGDLVDVFIVVEGNRTFGSGERRALRDWETDTRFDRWRDRIRRHVVDLDRINDAWAREYTQRNAIATALAEVRPAAADVVLIGDVDEFPPVDAIVGWRDTVVCAPRHLVFAPNLEHPVRHLTTAIVSGFAATSTPPQEWRARRTNLPRVHGGFHFSWMPNDDGHNAKQHATAHTEFTGVNLAAQIADRRHLDGYELTKVDPDGTWPVWFRDGHCPTWWWAT